LPSGLEVGQEIGQGSRGGVKKDEIAAQNMLAMAQGRDLRQVNGLGEVVTHP